MERRAFIWKLGAVPLAACVTFDGKVASAAAKFESGHYILFADAQTINIDNLAESTGVPGLPDNCFIEIVALKLRPGQTIDDAVRLYKVQDAGS
jgi:hypothetical protein